MADIPERTALTNDRASWTYKLQGMAAQMYQDEEYQKKEGALPHVGRDGPLLFDRLAVWFHQNPTAHDDLLTTLDLVWGVGVENEYISPLIPAADTIPHRVRPIVEWCLFWVMDFDHSCHGGVVPFSMLVMAEWFIQHESDAVDAALALGFRERP